MPKPPDSPPKTALKILLVGNLEDEALRLGDLLRHNSQQADMRRVDGAEGFATALASGKWDVVLADYTLPISLARWVFPGSLSQDFPAPWPRWGCCWPMHERTIRGHF